MQSRRGEDPFLRPMEKTLEQSRGALPKPYLPYLGVGSQEREVLVHAAASQKSQNTSLNRCVFGGGQSK
jgi:hypothetical protein